MGQHRFRPPRRRRPAEAVDHHVVPVFVLAQRLEVDLHLHADGEVVRAAREDRLHPRAFGQVDLGHAVAGHVGVLLAEQRDVAVGPGVDDAPGRELDVLGPLVQALGAHESAREEDLAAGGTAAPEEARRCGRVVGDPEEPLFNGDSGHALLASIDPSVRCVRARSGAFLDAPFASLPVRVAQPSLVELAVGISGHGLGEVDATRTLVLGQALGAVGLQLLGQCGCGFVAGGGLHDCLHLLAPLLVRDAEDGGVPHGG